MYEKYCKKVNLFKAFADPNRMMIISMLSKGKMCGCDLLEQLGITQPTLSHHMKILCDCGIVKGCKMGKWIFYSLNHDVTCDFVEFINELTRCKNQ